MQSSYLQLHQRRQQQQQQQWDELRTGVGVACKAAAGGGAEVPVLEVDTMCAIAGLMGDEARRAFVRDLWRVHASSRDVAIAAIRAYRSAADAGRAYPVLHGIMTSYNLKQQRGAAPFDPVVPFGFLAWCIVPDNDDARVALDAAVARFTAPYAADREMLALWGLYTGTGLPVRPPSAAADIERTHRAIAELVCLFVRHACCNIDRFKIADAQRRVLNEDKHVRAVYAGVYAVYLEFHALVRRTFLRTGVPTPAAALATASIAANYTRMARGATGPAPAPAAAPIVVAATRAAVAAKPARHTRRSAKTRTRERRHDSPRGTQKESAPSPVPTRQSAPPVGPVDPPSPLRMPTAAEMLFENPDNNVPVPMSESGRERSTAVPVVVPTEESDAVDADLPVPGLVRVGLGPVPVRAVSKQSSRAKRSNGSGRKRTGTLKVARPGAGNLVTADGILDKNRKTDGAVLMTSSGVPPPGVADDLEELMLSLDDDMEAARGATVHVSSPPPPPPVDATVAPGAEEAVVYDDLLAEALKPLRRRKDKAKAVPADDITELLKQVDIELAGDAKVANYDATAAAAALADVEAALGPDPIASAPATGASGAEAVSVGTRDEEAEAEAADAAESATMALLPAIPVGSDGDLFIKKALEIAREKIRTFESWHEVNEGSALMQVCKDAMDANYAISDRVVISLRAWRDAIDNGAAMVPVQQREAFLGRLKALVHAAPGTVISTVTPLFLTNVLANVALLLRKARATLLFPLEGEALNVRLHRLKTNPTIQIDADTADSHYVSSCAWFGFVRDGEVHQAIVEAYGPDSIGVEDAAGDGADEE